MLVPLLLLLGIVAYLYKRWSYSYWKRRNLYYIEPESFYGNIKDLMVGKASFTDQYKSLYDEFKSKGLRHGGFYEMFAPAYMPIDIEITKSIIQKDFANFRNHGEYTNEKVDPLSGHLLFLTDDKWKNLRAKLTPTFTSGKMKMMFPTMVSCSSGLKDLLQESADLQDVVDIKEIISRFTTDIIGSAAFGLDCNSLKNPNSEFREFGRNVFKGSKWRRIKRTLLNTLPEGFVTFFRIKRTPKEIEDFFMGVVNSTVKYREENKVFRKDFLHLLLQLKNKGYTTDDEDFLAAPDNHGKEGHFLTLNEVAAQCFVFFLAGFETSATATTFALLELAQNPDVQETLRKDINNVMKNHNNEMSYDAIMSMNYLDKVVNETLRKHPPASLTGRVCNTAYKVPGSDLIIEPGVKIRIPIQGIHRDPEYYPDPEKFDPERFSEENKATRPNGTFMPFGEGPRMCIGARFGLLQVKVGLATIIGNFAVTLNEKTQTPIKYDPKAVISGVKGDVWLNVRSVK